MKGTNRAVRISSSATSTPLSQDGRTVSRPADTRIRSAGMQKIMYRGKKTGRAKERITVRTKGNRNQKTRNWTRHESQFAPRAHRLFLTGIRASRHAAR